MNRRGFFSLLAGASAVALAPSLFARPSADPQWIKYSFGAPKTVRNFTLQLDSGTTFAAGGLGSGVSSAEMGKGGAQLLATLTPPPLA